MDTVLTRRCPDRQHHHDPGEAASLDTALVSASTRDADARRERGLRGAGRGPGRDPARRRDRRHHPAAGYRRAEGADPGERAVVARRGHQAQPGHDLPTFMNRRLGSVYVNEIQNNPFQPDVNFRGFTASPLLGTPQGLSVYLDGVRLNQPFGDVVSWDLIPRVAISSHHADARLQPAVRPEHAGRRARRSRPRTASRNPGIVGAGAAAARTAGRRSSSKAAAAATDGSTGSSPATTSTNTAGATTRRPTSASCSASSAGARSDTACRSRASLADTDLTRQRPAGAAPSRARLRQRLHQARQRPRTASLLLNLERHAPAERRAVVLGQRLLPQDPARRRCNGDINDDSLDQAVYQPNAAEQRALTAAGYTGFPTSGENAANTPFPKWRCIANALLQRRAEREVQRA